jgi:hypothetical protein
MAKIDLGMTVRDKITGLEGVAVARTTYLTGCDRISIQPRELKDGKTAEWSAFDENQLEIVKGKKIIDLTPQVEIAAQVPKVGGPRPNPEKR